MWTEEYEWSPCFDSHCHAKTQFTPLCDMQCQPTITLDLAITINISARQHEKRKSIRTQSMVGQSGGRKMTRESNSSSVKRKKTAHTQRLQQHILPFTFSCSPFFFLGWLPYKAITTTNPILSSTTSSTAAIMRRPPPLPPPRRWARRNCSAPPARSSGGGSCFVFMCVERYVNGLVSMWPLESHKYKRPNPLHSIHNVREA